MEDIGNYIESCGKPIFFHFAALDDLKQQRKFARTLMLAGIGQYWIDFMVPAQLLSNWNRIVSELRYRPQIGNADWKRTVSNQFSNLLSNRRSDGGIRPMTLVLRRIRGLINETHIFQFIFQSELENKLENVRFID